MFEMLIAGVVKQHNVVSTESLTIDPSAVSALEFLDGIFSSLDTKKKDECADIDNKNSHVQQYLDTAYKYSDAHLNMFELHIESLSDGIKGKKFNKEAFENLTLREHTIKYKLLQDGLFGMHAVTTCLEWLYSQKPKDSILAETDLVKRYDLHTHNNAYMTFRDKIESLTHYSEAEAIHHACKGAYTDAPKTKLSSVGYPATFVTDLISKSGQIVSSIKNVLSYREKCDHTNANFKKMIMEATSKDIVSEIGLLSTIATYNTAAAIYATAADGFADDAYRIAKHIVDHCYK